MYTDESATNTMANADMLIDSNCKCPYPHTPKVQASDNPCQQAVFLSDNVSVLQALDNGLSQLTTPL